MGIVPPLVGSLLAYRLHVASHCWSCQLLSLGITHQCRTTCPNTYQLDCRARVRARIPGLAISTASPGVYRFRKESLVQMKLQGGTTMVYEQLCHAREEPQEVSNAGSNDGGHEATVKGMPLASWLRQQ